MTVLGDLCVVCGKPTDKNHFITVTFYDKKNRSRGPRRCHIARKCTDKLPLTASERAEMDRVISMALEEQH